MKNIKLAVLAVLAGAVCFAAACAGNKKDAPAPAADTTVATELKTDSLFEKQWQLINTMNGCEAASDCVATFPTCCGTAEQPVFVNRKYEKVFVEEYRKLSNITDNCQGLYRCPRSYFGGLTKADCVANKCILSEKQN